MKDKKFRQRKKKRRESHRPGSPTSDNAREWEKYAHFIEGKLGNALTLLKKKVARGIHEREFYTEQIDRREQVLKDHGLWPLPEKTMKDFLEPKKPE